MPTPSSQPASGEPTPSGKDSTIRRIFGKAAVILLLCVLIVAAFTLRRVSAEPGEVILETDDPQVEGVLKEIGGVTFHERRSGRRFYLKIGPHSLPPGEYGIEVTEAVRGLEFSLTKFGLLHGGRVVIQVGLRKEGGKEMGNERP